MKRAIVLLSALVFCMGATSTITCDLSDIFFTILVPPGVDMELANNTPFPIKVKLAFNPDEIDIDDDDDLFDDGDDETYVILPGEVVIVPLTCREAAAVGIEHAEVLINDGPEEDTVSFWEGVDYFCGEVVAFDFFVNTTVTDLLIDVAVFDE